MQCDTLHAASQSYILHPEHEEEVLLSDNILIEQLKDEWNRYVQSFNLRAPISFSAFLMHKRIEMYQRGYPSDEYHSVFQSYDELLYYGFITYKNRHLIRSEEEYILYDISIDEAIQVQEDLLFELIDLDVHLYEDLFVFFYHHPNRRYTETGDDTYLLHRYSVWWSYTGAGDSLILPHDVKAVIRKHGWMDKDYQIYYPEHIILSEDDLEEGADTSIVHHTHLYKRDALSEMVQRRPYIFTPIYPGTLLHGRDVYASRVMYMIDIAKLPPGWDDSKDMYMRDHDGSLFRDGVYPLIHSEDSMTMTAKYLYNDTEERTFWTKPETLFTLSHSNDTYQYDIDILF